MKRTPCECRFCGTELQPNTGLIRYGFCSDGCRDALNDAGRRGLTPSQARAEWLAQREAAA